MFRVQKEQFKTSYKYYVLFCIHNIVGYTYIKAIHISPRLQNRFSIRCMCLLLYKTLISLLINNFLNKFNSISYARIIIVHYQGFIISVKISVIIQYKDIQLPKIFYCCILYYNIMYITLFIFTGEI